MSQTSRKLCTRVNEHIKNINKNNVDLNVVSHRLAGHGFDWSNVSILDDDACYRRRLISEMIYISL